MPRTGTEALSRGGDYRLVKSFALRVVGGSSKGRAYTTASGVTTVGTHASTDFVLEDGAMSRFHCEIAVAEGQAVVRDLGSKNGTFVDGVQVLAAPLRPGATLLLGRTKIRFEAERSSARVALSGRERFGTLVGRSPAMREVFARLEKAAASDATVLLGGETGTGKDAAAESIHAQSARAAGPFTVVDCGAISRQLLESEIFGHEAGAFTGARGMRHGAFEMAQGGTVFLDEVGELPLDLQPRFLRVLERFEVQRVGGTAWLPVDVRVVAATNRNLRREVNEGRFRADLFYRLAVVEVVLPPLRERLEDLPLLIESIVERLGAGGSAAARSLTGEQSLAELASHKWPGNLRELRNFVERAVLQLEREPLSDTAVPAVAAGEPLRVARERWLSFFERRFLADLLERSGGNVSEAARAAGVARVHLHRLIKKYELR